MDINYLITLQELYKDSLSKVNKKLVFMKESAGLLFIKPYVFPLVCLDCVFH